MKTKYFTVAILAILALSSCATESDVFDVEELNISQTGRTVEILNVTSVKIKSTSKEGVAVATAGGAAAGGIVGKKKSKDKNKTADTVLGATAGGVLGYASGKLAGLVTTEGVTISFKGYGRGIQTVTQKGKRCQFKEGQTLLIVTGKNRIRIQPNSNCD